MHVHTSLPYGATETIHIVYFNDKETPKITDMDPMRRMTIKDGVYEWVFDKGIIHLWRVSDSLRTRIQLEAPLGDDSEDFLIEFKLRWL